MVSVEELDFSIRDGSTCLQFSTDGDKQLLKVKTSGPESNRSNTTRINSREKLILQNELANQPQKHGTLPSIPVGKDDKNSRSLGDSFMCGDKHNYEQKVLHNQSSLENLKFNGKMQGGSVKCGKKVLSPLPDRQPLDETRQRSNTSPEVMIPKIKRITQADSHRAHQNFETGKDGEEQRTLAQLRTNDSFLAPDDAGSFLGVSQNRRRLSAPLSPRFVRRLIPDKFYSKSRNEENLEDNKSITERQARAPERSAIFSPPFQEFDSIIQDEQKHKEFLKTKTSKSPRKSLDLDFRTNPTRFLSEIKVSLGDKTQLETQRKHRVKTDKRKQSYSSLSTSSEALFSGDILPPVKTTMPEVAPKHGRHRALSLSLLTSERSDVSKQTFDCPMFLDVGTQRLSHLSLSPRLPRKF